MAKKPGSKKEATGKAVFNTDNDAEFAKQVGANVGTNKKATGQAVFNTKTDTEFAKQVGAGKQAAKTSALNMNNK